MKLRRFNNTAMRMRIQALKFDQRGPEWADRAREMRESADEIDPPETITAWSSSDPTEEEK